MARLFTLKEMIYLKLRNGFGNVSKLNGKRRNPYRARITTGWEYDEINDKYKQVYATIGYFKKREDAIKALSKYHDDPYDIKSKSITFSEVYDKWSSEHFENIVPSAIRTWKSAYKYCEPLYKKPFKEIRVADLEDTIKTANVGDTTKMRMKSMFNLIYKYALKHEIVDKDYASLCTSVKKSTSSKKKIPFSEDEVNTLWNNLNYPNVDIVLIGIYSGWRPQELAILKKEDIDLDNKTMFGGLKTDAGKNRYVPIHEKIYELVKNRYNNSNDTLFEEEEGNLTYDKYRTRFKNVMNKFGMKHTPHETRHTFISNAKKYNVDEYCIKLMVGHAIEDVTEKVYTHRELKQLHEEINKIL